MDGYENGVPYRAEEAEKPTVEILHGVFDKNFRGLFWEGLQLITKKQCWDTEDLFWLIAEGIKD